MSPTPDQRPALPGAARRPGAVSLLGIFVVLLGLGWSALSLMLLSGEMLPYPDPRPEDLALQEAGIRYWTTSLKIGLGLTLVGSVVLVANWISQRQR